MHSFEWAIEDILAAFPSLDLAHDAAKAVAVMGSVGSPCDFLVQLDRFRLPTVGDDERFMLNVSWNPKTGSAAKRMKLTEQHVPIIEGAAVQSIQEQEVMRGKNGTPSKLLEDMLRESSWHVSHALALSEQGRSEEARTAWLAAAEREERVACLLEAEGHEVETAVHYVSAASCLARVADYVHAVALVRCALSFALRPAYQREVEKLLQGWLSKAKQQLRRQESKRPARVPCTTS
jgi:hypothetical protein